MKEWFVVKHVEQALRKTQGIKEVEVNLDEKSARVQMDRNVPDDILKSAIEEAGYQLVNIQ